MWSTNAVYSNVVYLNAVQVLGADLDLLIDLLQFKTRIELQSNNSEEKQSNRKVISKMSGSAAWQEIVEQWTDLAN